jgi:hypothetical protein
MIQFTARQVGGSQVLNTGMAILKVFEIPSYIPNKYRDMQETNKWSNLPSNKLKNYTDQQERRLMGRRERQSVQQAIEADWLTRARDFKCAEQSKTRPLSAPITCVSWCRAEKDRAYKQMKLIGSRWLVTLNAQNPPKLGRFHICWSL